MNHADYFKLFLNLRGNNFESSRALHTIVVSGFLAFQSLNNSKINEDSSDKLFFEYLITADFKTHL
jgi:hypothetical protein